ncbi:MAG: class I SAM-dependent methyltransferase [Planctomycetota bacterium]|nr:class I SAM-dependent methyltransferase [Planctomycetota bacterium]MDA1211170.1 class I SAM-dependent methyltransferase [Planctomycetota bacterium]
MSHSPPLPAGPTPADIFETLNAHQQSAALRGAIELDLFTAISQGHTTAQALASHCQADVRAMRILCDYLTVYGYLTKSGNEYGLPPTVSTFLVRTSPQYMGSIARFINSPDLLGAFNDVAAIVRTGSTQISGQGTIESEYDGWVEFARSMVPIMMPAAEFMADLAEKRHQGPTRILDIAAGHGMFGVSIARRLPEATVAALDWENVLAVAHENAKRHGVHERYELLSGDAFEVDFGNDFDLVLLTNILHHFDQPTCVKLMSKVANALTPDGTAMTLEFIPNKDRVTPPASATFSFMMLGTTPAGDAYTLNEYEAMWSQAGLTKHEMIDVPNSAQRVLISRR